MSAVLALRIVCKSAKLPVRISSNWLSSTRYNMLSSIVVPSLASIMAAWKRESMNASFDIISDNQFRERERYIAW